MNCRKMDPVKLSYNWIFLILILLPFCKGTNADQQLIELQFVDTKFDTLFDGGTGKLFRYENSDTTLIIGGVSYTGKFGHTLLQTFTTDTIAEIKSGNRLITFLSFINGKPWMFFDTDNDNEISDEKPYEVGKAKNIRLDNRTYFDGKKFTSRSYYIDPIHSTFAFDGKEDRYINNLAVLKTVIRMAQYKIDGRTYTFCLPRGLSKGMDYKDPKFFILLIHYLKSGLLQLGKYPTGLRIPFTWAKNFLLLAVLTQTANQQLSPSLENLRRIQASPPVFSFPRVKDWIFQVKRKLPLVGTLRITP